MSFVPNLRTKRPDQEYVQSKIDVLVNYLDVLNAAETAGGLVTGIPNPSSFKVAVVGTGPAGVVAAYELLRLGVNVDIYSSDQASYRYGRAFSYPFPGNEQYLAEMGAMRFPPSEAGLFFYLKKFGIGYSDKFPDPGKVDTLLYVNGKSYTWPAGGSAPSLFDTVTAGLKALMTEDTLYGQRLLVAPTTMAQDMIEGAYDSARLAWQDWITHFEHLSFGAGLSALFQLNQYPPGGTKWTDDDMEIFGTIGVGSGGFGSLFSVQFLEIFRLFVNELETDQKFIPTGIASVYDAIATAKVNGVSVIDRHIAHDIVDVQPAGSGQGQINLTSDAGTTQTYDRVIWAAPKWASQANTTLVEFLQTTFSPPPAPGAPNVVSAVKELHTISSSKAFILTKDKFWLKNPGMPANIQSDTLIRGLYCLDYTPDQSPDGLGVVLISYTWQDDSAKQIALSSDQETRIKRLVEDVKQIDADFAANLVPLNGDYKNNTIFIDWLTQPRYHGAFKLNYPRQDILLQAAYTSFMTAGGSADPHLYLAGDDVSFMGGWCEGAIETAINAVSAVGVSLGGTPVTPSVFNGRTKDYYYHVGIPGDG